MVSRYNVSLWASRHSWEPAFDFCQCLIKIMLILTIKLQLCNTKQRNAFTTMLSILFIYCFSSPSDRQLWEMSTAKLSVAVLQTFMWGFQFKMLEKTPVLFWAIYIPFFSKSQPTEGENPQTLNHNVAPAVLKYLCMQCWASQTILAILPILYGDPNSLLSWCAGIMLLCEKLERSSPAMGVDKNLPFYFRTFGSSSN